MIKSLYFKGGITNGEGILEMNMNLANEIQAYRVKYSREPILVSLKYANQPHTTVNNSWWSLILIMTNLYNIVTITMTTPESNII